ncbi:hypothetical protein [Haloquadratum walsbyi]|uniref:Uncharacterized protein n=1 Tax=Haloquadratum walsbyi J07HQW2 TaxID=1238425 RepID=U1NAS9_9EURY|nr:hypothetical protein [Haloquadratum walsbyi]ERG93723.1 MAG: hypothetical protein J07HQW2_00156 [Haloquadratum walsbyi J07HQW2]
MDWTRRDRRDTETTEFSSHGETGAHGPDHREYFSCQFGWNCDRSTEQYYDHDHDHDHTTPTPTPAPTPEPTPTRTFSPTPEPQEIDSPGFSISTALIAGFAILLTAYWVST